MEMRKYLVVTEDIFVKQGTFKQSSFKLVETKNLISAIFICFVEKICGNPSLVVKEFAK